MKIREIECKSALTKTRIPGHSYCLNPYVGCAHGCRYCYAAFMRRFTGDEEEWGTFVNVKTNIHPVLRCQLKRAKRGSVLVSTVTDPYQPLEEQYQLTRKCLQALADYRFPVCILTRSPLCLRDADIFQQFKEIEIGLSIATDDEKVKQLFEPCSPPISQRVACLRRLHELGLSTYAFIGPLLPLDPVKLVEMLSGAVQHVLIDRMNYQQQSKRVYEQADLCAYLHPGYIQQTAQCLEQGFSDAGVSVSLCF